MSSRIAIVGAGGGVGSSVAYNLLLAPEPYAITLVDGRSGMAVSHEMDLQQVVAAGASGSVAIVERGAVVEADVVVVSAATPLTVNRSREVYLHNNAAIVRSVVDALPDGWPGVVLMVTNPVDALVTWLARERPDLRVLGYTANDGLRLRTAIGQLLGVPSASVDAWVIGEHGDHCVPLLDRVRVDGEPVTLSAAQRAAAVDFVRSWYVRHVALDSGRSSTWTTGHGVTRMIAALGAGDELWPASVMLAGEYGVRDVALSVPVALASGAIADWSLSDAEAAGMRAAADAIRAGADAID
ncbi:lactate/malate family dehydrogenase [Baekduia sp. Peel2402]|uniref:lactate/malate family dehydrogenase n=1 Tax=Baekduia sp. Peel2402 TaxID=3458296 RepID=UPI00403EA6AE